MKYSAQALAILIVLLVSLTRVQAQGINFYQEGIRAYNQTQYIQAIQDFQQAVQNHPLNWKAYQYLAYCYYDVDDYPNALVSCNKSLKIHSKNESLLAFRNNVRNQLASESTSVSAAPNNASTPNYPNTGYTTEQFQPAMRSYQYTMMHPRYWSRFWVGYDYANLGDLKNAATAMQQYGYTATEGSSGWDIGGEIGWFLGNRNNGLALGIDYLGSQQYTISGSSSSGVTELTIEPSAVPLELSWYHFWYMPHSRFYLTVGGAYYFADAYYSYYDSTNGSSSGNFTGSAFGPQVGAGYDWQVGPHFLIGFFGRYRIVKIPSLTYDNGSGPQALLVFPDNTIGVDYVSNMVIDQARYATLDYTGFDVSLSLSFVY